MLSASEVVDLAGPAAVVPLPGSRIVGVLTRVDEHTVTIRLDAAAVEIIVPRAAIALLERSAGERSRTRYAAIGAWIGLGAGVIAGLAFPTGCQPDELFCSAVLTRLRIGEFGTLGAVAGAVTGAIFPPGTRWAEVDDTALTDVPQPLSQQPSQKLRRLEAAINVGAPWSGPARDLEAAMQHAGFGDTSPGSIFPGNEHPHSDAGVGVSFNALYRVWPSWQVGLVYSRTSGRTVGFHGPSSQFLLVDYDVTTAAAVVVRTFGPAMVSAGPARYSTGSSESDAGQSAHPSRQSRTGVLAQAGLRLPAHTRLYLDLDLQYRYVGRAAVGPFTPPAAFGAVASQLPETHVSFSHWFVGVGPGLRF